MHVYIHTKKLLYLEKPKWLTIQKREYIANNNTQFQLLIEFQHNLELFNIKKYQSFNIVMQQHTVYMVICSYQVFILKVLNVRFDWMRQGQLGRREEDKKNEMWYRWLLKPHLLSMSIYKAFMQRCRSEREPGHHTPF